MISLIEDISSISISSFFSYALGYFIVILSAIILISIYIINKEFLDTSMGKKESKGKQDDLLKLLKERYIKGEISKEEFDQMKKDIE